MLRVQHFIRLLLGMLPPLAIVLATILGVTAILDRPTLWLQGGFVPGWWLLVGLLGVLLATGLRYGLGSRAARRALHAGQGVPQRLVAGLGVALKLLLLGTITSAALIAPFQPTLGDRYHILLDDPGVNDSAYAEELLLTAARHASEARRLGCEPIFDTSELAAIARGRAEESTLERGRALLRERGTIALPLGERLRRVARELRDRHGDTVVVLSAQRAAPTDLPDWPTGPFTQCVWVDVRKDVGANRVRVLSWEVQQDPAVESILRLDVEAPDNQPAPILHVRLVGEKEGWTGSFNPPPRGTRPIDDQLATFGRLGDRVCYRVPLPRLGQRLKLHLETPGNPEPTAFSGRQFDLAPRVLQVKLEDRLAPLRELPAFTSTKDSPSPVRFDPPPSEAAGREVSFVSGMLAKQLDPERPTVEVIWGSGTEMRGPWKLVREPAYQNLDIGGAWVGNRLTSGFPDLTHGLKQHEKAANEDRVLVRLVSDKGGDAAVVFQRKPSARPGYVTVIIPPPERLASWPAPRQKAICHLLVWAGSLAERSGRSRPPVQGEEVELDERDHQDEQPTRPPLWRQLTDALRGTLDDRRPGLATNSAIPEVLWLGGLALLVLLTLSAALSVRRTSRPSR